jgi:predicted GNAT family N-acyltransferase
MERQGSVILVIEINNIIVATGKLFIETKFHQCVAHLEDIVVDKEYRGIGIGQKMIKELLNCVPESCHKVVLQGKQELTNFYKKINFKPENSGFVYRLK